MNEVKNRASVAIINVPGTAALKCMPNDSGIPRVTAHIETINCEGKMWQECSIYIGDELLADLKVFRGKSFAVDMVRRALKGAVSRLGKHRRMTANKRMRKAEAAVAEAEEREAVKEAENAFI